MEFHIKTESKKKYILCANSKPGGKYFAGYICGNYIPHSDGIVEAVCTRCVQILIGPPPETIEKVKDTRPRGWSLKKLFVDLDGTVYHKGVEQPALKGMYPPTPIVEKLEEVLTPEKTKELKAEYSSRIEEIKAELLREKRVTRRNALSKEMKSLTRKIKKLI